jgi:hypothetical protein
MRIVSTLVALSLATCFAENSSTISLSNGIRLRVTVNTGNDDPDPLKLEMKAATGNSVYRVLRDDSGLAVWAYELVVDRLPDGNHFQITAKPAGQRFAAKFPNADGGKPTPTVSMPLQSPPLGPGGRFAIEIPTNPGLFQHRTDTVEVQPDAEKNPAASTEPLIRFAGLRVAVKGEVVPAGGEDVAVSGPYAMFYIPQRGGYFFSTTPVAARPFVQVGDADHNRLKFTIDNDDYECVATAPILVQSDRGQIWVYHDPKFKPTGSWTKSNPKSPDQFFTAASDSLNWWLP